MHDVRSRAIQGGSDRNRLLEALSPAEAGRLAPLLQHVEIKPRQILHHWNARMESVYFIQKGLVSVSAKTSRDTSVEVWLIGSEGMTGIPVVLGSDLAPPHRRVVQVGGQALRIAAADLQAACEEMPSLKKLLLRYVDVVLLQTSQSGACNAQHSVKQRLARWLLLARSGLNSDELPITHRSLSRLLGIRRATVTECLGTLEREGAVGTRRGRIRVVDTEALERTSCDCHRLILREYERLIGRGRLPAHEDGRVLAGT